MRDADDGFCAMKSATDLREKLRRDYSRLGTDPGDADVAFNFFLTADRMVDWRFPDDAGARAATRSLPLVALTSELARGVKVLRVHERRGRSGDATRRGGYFANYLGAYFGWHFGRGRLTVDLTGETAAAFGDQISALDLARQVLAYWDRQPDLG